MIVGGTAPVLIAKACFAIKCIMVKRESIMVLPHIHTLDLSSSAKDLISLAFSLSLFRDLSSSCRSCSLSWRPSLSSSVLLSAAWELSTATLRECVLGEGGERGEREGRGRGRRGEGEGGGEREGGRRGDEGREGGEREEGRGRRGEGRREEGRGREGGREEGR